MWKNVKRMLSCMLALILLLSVVNGQQIFVRADSEAVIKGQSDNKIENEEVKGEQEGASSAKTTVQIPEKTTEESTEERSEKTTEAGREDEESDKSDENNENDRSNGNDSDIQDNSKEIEDTTQENKDREEAAENTSEDVTDTTEEEIPSQEQEADNTKETGTIISTEKTATKVSEKEVEYVPKSQPKGMNIKAYAKENVFPKGTVIKIKELENKKRDSAEQVLIKEKVSYDSFRGYDIGFYAKTGKEIEPDEGTVRLEAELDKGLFPKGMQEDTLQIQHLKEEKKARTVETVAKAANDKIYVNKDKIKATFEVRSFSDFIFTWKGDTTAATPLKVTVSRAVIEKQISHQKYAVLREDGTYDLTLTVAGKKGTQTNKAKLDVVFILDKSGSMSEKFGRTTKCMAASNAMNGLAESLSENTNIDAKFSLVTFSGNTFDGTWNDAQIAVGWTGDASKIKSASAPDSYGGTNYQAGIRTAKELLSAKRENAMTAVIFLSDGDPTFYYNTYGETEGKGNNNDPGGTANLTASLNAAKNEIANLGVNYFYTVGVGSASDYTNLSALCTSSGVSGARNFDGTDTTELNNAFNTIESEILTFLCSDVSVEDVLSENVELLKNEEDSFKPLKITVEDKNGTVVAQGEDTVTFKDGDREVSLQAGYDSKARKITLNFPADYQLNADYTYKVTANIAATEKAYANYRKNDNKYVDTGDAGTGTHAKEEGMYSNQNNEAKLTYTFRGTKYTEFYDKPVIKLHPGKLILEKELEGLDDLTKEELTQYKKNLKFVIKVTTKKNTELKNEEKTLEDFELKNGKYIYTVMEGIDPGSIYEIQEKDGEIEGYEWKNSEDKRSENGTIEKDKTATVSFQNIYNKKQVIPPTGISTTMMAWLLMTGATLVLGLVFLLFEIQRKRRMI